MIGWGHIRILVCLHTLKTIDLCKDEFSFLPLYSIFGIYELEYADMHDKPQKGPVYTHPDSFVSANILLRIPKFARPHVPDSLRFRASTRIRKNDTNTLEMLTN